MIYTQNRYESKSHAAGLVKTGQVVENAIPPAYEFSVRAERPSTLGKYCRVASADGQHATVVGKTNAFLRS